MDRLRHPLFSKDEADKLRTHVLNCRWCRAEYLLISNLQAEEIPDHVFSNEGPEPSGQTQVATKASNTIESRTADLHLKLNQYSHLRDELERRFDISDREKDKLKLKLEVQMAQVERLLTREKNKLS